MESETATPPAEEIVATPPPAEPAFVVIPVAEWNSLVGFLHGGGAVGAPVSPRLFEMIFGSAGNPGIIRSGRAVPAGTVV